MVFKGPFQPKPFCMILRYSKSRARTILLKTVGVDVYDQDTREKEVTVVNMRNDDWSHHMSHRAMHKNIPVI